MIDAAAFQELRPYLFAIAYRMLGSASDAEDVVQDAYLRAASGASNGIRSSKAYLATIVTRLCLDRLKSARAMREQYVGAWLPEPVLTAEGADVEGPAERHEWITLAFLTLLESLSPQERAVFLLREVFEYGYDEIARTVGLTPANCRQIFHRARGHVAGAPLSHARARPHQATVVERFKTALQAGDADAATALLAADVTLQADGGGKAPAARWPLAGQEQVARLLHGIIRAAARVRGEVDIVLHTAVVNAEPAVLIWLNGRLDTVFVCGVEEDRIARIFALRNPEKLRHLEASERHRLPH
jgi:RNA polymerase sigma-70 factor (ECF subfamily)